MARRKSRTKPAQKKRLLEKLDKVFCCLFCNHMYGVECVMDRKLKLGTTAIDIYTEWITEWINECERVNNDEEEVL
ncbi:hypothetical protein MKW98_031939 [Papaver atlanticum]|uniref:Transcription elongation factor 1 homolog n=1 Tax=Papaver atlanticum TaxID=357466 RepID=A0AAD4XCB6_9MAGN|nr:hypothetical protein MKW98_031939 [Papaver atlanticum]